MNYKIVIFDMDGTILDTISDLADSVNFTMAHFNYPTHTLDEVKTFVGNGIHKLIERAVPNGTSEADIERTFEFFKSYYVTHNAIKTMPYEGIPNLLLSLRQMGILTAVLSNKVESAVIDLDNLYFAGLFDMELGDTPDRNLKPAPDGINYILKSFGLNPSEALYVGDSEVDIETAKNASVDSVLVSWGFRTREALAAHGANRIIDTPNELLTLV